jgi:hypothetical protein
MPAVIFCKLIKVLIFIVSVFLSIEGCSESAPGTVISAEAIGNWVNFNGMALIKHPGGKNSSVLRNHVTASPAAFYIDVRILKIKILKKEWITLLEKGPTEKREIIGMSSIAPRSLIPSGDYTAFLIGYSPDWYLKGSFTSPSGLITNFIITNKGTSSADSNIDYILFGTPEAVEEIKSSTNPYASANVSFIGLDGITLVGGDYREIYLYFDTLGMINIYTNDSGDATNMDINSPTLQIDIK